MPITNQTIFEALQILRKWLNVMVRGMKIFQCIYFKLPLETQNLVSWMIFFGFGGRGGAFQISSCDRIPDEWGWEGISRDCTVQAQSARVCCPGPRGLRLQTSAMMDIPQPEGFQEWCDAICFFKISHKYF